jgi:erythromycin esterase
MNKAVLRLMLASGAISMMTSALAGQTDTAFVEWARGQHVSIDSSREAFRALDAGISGATLIGMGESVHETEPFGAFRLQLLQDLVQRHGVTALVLESGLPDALALDAYVQGRAAAVDFDTAIPGDLGTLTEIRRTMEWLREWNLNAGRKRPVHVYGSDLPGRQGSMVPALDRLQDFLPQRSDVQAGIDAIRPVATRISDTWWQGAAQKYDSLSAAEKSTLESNVRLLGERVTAVSGGEADRVEWARRIALVLQQSEETLRLGMFAPAAPRDRAMAANTLWVLSRLGADERAVYWAHNAHVQRAVVTGPALPPGRFPSAGSRFADALGTRYYAIGTAYGGPARWDATVASMDSVDATLEKVDQTPFLLVLRTAARPSAVNAWLTEERLMRFQGGYLLLPLATAFDAVAYFDHATPAARATIGH